MWIYGEHIGARRLDLGLLQKEAAELIGVDETSVYNWESNRVQPAVHFIPESSGSSVTAPTPLACH